MKNNNNRPIGQSRTSAAKTLYALMQYMKKKGVIWTGAIDSVLQVCLALASSSFLRCGYCCPKCHEINRGRVWVG